MARDPVQYAVEFNPRALRDIAALPRQMQQRVFAKIEQMQEGLTGDVKRLTNFTPEYRLRVGDYRALFEIDGTRIIIHRVLHRRDVYR